MSTSTYGLTGLTCGHCVNAVTEEVSAIEGVSDVKVDLVTGGTSTLTLTADREVSKDALAAAVDEAGDYQLTDAPA
ncbi:heavy-metal-associated domain-containing protein [Brachybacterium sp. p3-SID1565]|uniref:heavy-metal-associated domain-containing protein n=1 Tax=Brachybacterium TaxID=43668 RepID=UPI0021AA593D|nr:MULTISPECIES: heavy-metal-associated domain-containing protein [unclassified Brachybacterium]MCT1385012.1 heavy-metal-associated domain-containing protein [Brachybacterium sp. p3-SID1565]MCT1775320.1 heavy-metal-associated domain-containing protein [Brachybacterium sp. p3-SID957]